MTGDTEHGDHAATAAPSSRLLNSLMLILIGTALGLFWHDAVQAAARLFDRLTQPG